MRARTGVVVGIALCAWVVGCGQGGEGEAERAAEGASYLVFDRAAREAGVRLDGVSARDAVLPIEIAGGHAELRGPAGDVALDLAPGEIALVRGAGAAVDRGALDVDVARDRVAVVGSEAAASALAAEVGGVVDVRGDRFVVVGPEALVGVARAALPDGVDEIVPVLPGDAAGRPAFASGVFRELGELERAVARHASSAAPATFDLAAFERERLALPPDQLLPGPVDCPDPVVGTWVSREHYPEWGDWYRFELRVRRDAREPSRLVGSIGARSWAGAPDLALPDRCAPEDGDGPGAGFDWTVRMAAAGTVEGAAVSFGGRSLAIEGTRCGPRFEATGYRLDQFTGTLVEGGRYLRAVNNDGGRSVDDPHLFRRVACD